MDMGPRRQPQEPVDKLRMSAERGFLDRSIQLENQAGVRLDLFVDATPFRLLLAYTSAKNFLTYHAKLHQRDIRIEDRLHRLTVINRGSWGEVRFYLQD